MKIRTYNDSEIREATQIAIDRLRELDRADTAKVITRLEELQATKVANWTWAAVEVHQLVGNELTMDADTSWALLPFFIRAFNLSGGPDR